MRFRAEKLWNGVLTRRFVRCAALATSGTILIACHEDGVASVGPTLVKLSIASHISVGASQAEQLSVAARVGYLRQRVGVATPVLIALGSAVVNIDDAPGRLDIPIEFDVAPCLADPARVGAGDDCPVFVSLSLRVGSVTADSTQLGPLAVQAGRVVTQSQPVELRSVARLQLSWPGQAPSTSGDTLRPGRTLQLTATPVNITGATVSPRPVVWASASTTVATVNATTGLVTAVAPGTALISATSGGRVGTFTAQVLAPSQPAQSVLSGSITSNRTLTADTVYVLRGFVFVANGATLTIAPGTRIVGDSTALGSTLYVLRGSRINANGTAAAPIVFTSQRAPGSRAPGDWGGLVIVGNARTSRTGNVILEGSNGSVIGANPNGVIYTGGSNDADNSGTLRYVRVEFAGYATLTDSELNSFTFASVGAGTTLEYLQALAGLDDSFEWFGGTVDGRYLVSYEAGDDHFDAAEGYRGRNQFLIGLQTAYLSPRPGSGGTSTDPQGFEIDGCGSLGGCIAPGGASTQSAGRDDGLWNMSVFANFTLVGVPTGVTAPGGGGMGSVLRRGTGGHYINGVIARWPRGGISLRDSTTNNRFQEDSLIVRNLYFAENGALAGGSNFDGTGTNFGQESAFAARNSNIVVGANVTAASLFVALPPAGTATTGASFDWSPAVGSPIAVGGLSTFATDPRIAARAGAFIVPTAYRGAAAQGGVKWWEGWTSYARN